MVDCLAPSARVSAPCYLDDVAMDDVAMDGPTAAMLAAVPQSLSHAPALSHVPAKSPRGRLWAEASLVAFAALCLVLVPSVQSLGLSVGTAVAGPPQNPVAGQALAGGNSPIHSLALDEVASLLSAG